MICNEKKALATALRILTKKSYSKIEIINKLKKYEYDEESIEYVINKLLDMELLNDLEYAKEILKSYKDRGYGKQRIKQELYKRHIDYDVTKEVLEEFFVDFDKILYFYDAKLRGEIDDFDKIQKVKAFLYRKGFSFDEINEGFSLYKEILEEENAY